MQRQLFFVILLSFFLHGAFSPYLVTSATVKINESGSVIVHGGELNYLQLSIQIPRNSSYQQVFVDRKINTDKEGNAYITIEQKGPKNPFHYSIGIEAKAKSRRVLELPDNFELTNEELKYLVPTNRTQSNHPDILELSKNITENSASNFEKVAKIAIWVHQNIRYDETYIGKKSDALSVLKNREGVCFEYATLFAALARAAGIPTKYVSGYVYSEKYGTWLGHVWNEVYIGKWVPVDATWLEVGAVDALHIENGKAHELTEENTLIAKIYPQDAKLEWETTGKSGPIASNIEVIAIEQEPPSNNYKIDAAAKRLPPKKSTVVFMEIEGEDYRVIPVTLAGCIGVGAFEIENETKYLILQPNRKTIAYWIIRAPANVQPGYYYSCPLTVNSPYLERKTVTIKVDPRTNFREFQASISNKEVNSGDDLFVELNFSGATEEYRVYAITESQVAEKTVLPEKMMLIVPSSEAFGKKLLILAGENGGYVVLPYEVAPAEGEVQIGNIEAQKMTVGKEGKVSFEVQAKKYPKTIDIQFEYEDKKLNETIVIEGPSKIELPIYLEKPGLTSFLIRISTNQKTITRYGVIDAKLAPSAKIETIRIQRLGGSMYEVLVLISKEGDVKNLSVKMDNVEKYPQHNETTFIVKGGNYTLEMRWFDEGGKLHEERVLIATDMEEPNLRLCLPGMLAALLTIFVCMRRD
ncbi:MAG: transglutaminase-like domain-containing protein [Candidatus Anstonellaceae archaeon]